MHYIFHKKIDLRLIEWTWHIFFKQFSTAAKKQCAKHTFQIAAYDKNILVGYLAGNFNLGGMRIKALAVKDSYRKQNIGTDLLNQALEYATKNKIKFCTLETFNFQALNFYKNMGFYLEFERQGYEGNSSLYYLRKDL